MLLQQVEAAAGFGASFFAGGFKKDPRLVAAFFYAIAACVQVRECHFRRYASFFYPAPEQAHGKGQIALAMIPFQDTSCLLKFVLTVSA